MINYFKALWEKFKTYFSEFDDSAMTPDEIEALNLEIAFTCR